MTRFHYILGFVLSLVLTLLASILLVVQEMNGYEFLSNALLRFLFIVLALLQCGVQLVFFLHVRDEQKSQWNTLALVSALLAVCILVGGTLWIMNNLMHENPMPDVSDEVPTRSNHLD